MIEHYQIDSNKYLFAVVLALYKYTEIQADLFL